MKTDVTSKANRGKMNIHYNKKRDNYRIRFSKVHADQLKIIKSAIEKSRNDSGTEHDIVALNDLCLHYLTTD